MAKHKTPGTTPTRTFRLRPETVKKVEAIFEAGDFRSYDEFFNRLCTAFLWGQPKLKAKLGLPDKND